MSSAVKEPEKDDIWADKWGTLCTVVSVGPRRVTVHAQLYEGRPAQREHYKRVHWHKDMRLVTPASEARERNADVQR